MPNQQFFLQSSQINTPDNVNLLQTLLSPGFWLAGFAVIVLIVVLIIIIKLLITKFLDRLKDASEEKASLNSVIFEVRVPRNNEIEIQASDQMFSSLLGISKEMKGLKQFTEARSFISLEIIALPEMIKFYVVCSKEISNTVEKGINSTFPAAEVIFVDEYNIFADGAKVEFASLRLDKDSYKPIRTYEDLSVDSMSSMLTTMSKLNMGEAAAVQVIITSAGSEWRNQGKKFVNKVHSHNSDPEKKKMDVAEDLLMAIEKKCEKGGFYTDINLVAVAANSEAARIHLESMISTFQQLGKEGSNSFRKADLSKKSKNDFVRDFIYRLTSQRMILNTAELATIFHFPNKNVDAAHVNWLMAKRAPATSGIPSNGDLWLGTNIYRDVKKQIFMMRDDRRRHMYMIGKTGAGKSYLLQQMVLQDIIKGEGVAFLDPHGEHAEWLLERIPPHRIEDVIYWNPGDVDRPLGFNILAHYGEQDKHRVVNSFVGLMQKMYDPHNQGITGPRFERAVRNAMLTVMEDPDATLVEVLRILSDEKYAARKIPLVKDDMVRRYWTDEIAKTQDFHKSEVLGYIVSKFDRFVTNKLTRNIFGQSKSGFDFRQVMDQGKILIVNLSKGLIGEENAQFLGLLIVPKILSAAMSRADMDPALRRDFYLYVDEFQNFSTEDFAQILSEARKYRLNLIVANQYIAQIDEKIRDAVFGNVGSVIGMKVGTSDAQFLETIYTPVFDANDLTNLENTNAYVKMLYKGESPPAFSINTHYKYSPYNIPKEGNKKVSEIVRNLSRYRYGRDRALVEAEIRKRAELSSDFDKDDKGSGGFGGGAGGFSTPLAPPK
ncbi:MAG: hypothetical protein WCJ58_02990 [bacterium]